MKKQVLIPKIFLVFLLFLFSLISSLLLSKPILAKSYSIDQTQIEIFLQSDGSAEVIEQRVFNFQGDYRFVYQKIPYQNEQSLTDSGRSEPYLLNNFELCEVDQSSGVNQYDCYEFLEQNQVNLSEARNNPEKTFYVELRPNEYFLQWHYQALNEKKIFELRYEVENLLTQQNNVAELYWQFVGDDWEVAHGIIDITVWLPANFLASQLKDVQAWGHGPLAGVVNIDALPSDNGLYGVHFTAAALPIAQFLEGRVILPMEVLIDAETLPVGKLNRQEISEQEQQFIAETEAKLKREETIAKIIFVIASLLSILGMIFFVKSLLAHLKLAKEERLQALPGVWEPPSDLEPALVYQLLHKTKKLNPSVFTATVLSLVHKKVCRIVRSDKKEGFIKKDYRYFLELTDKAGQAKLSVIEQEVFDFLFNKVIKLYGKYYHRSSKKWLNEQKFNQLWRKANLKGSHENLLKAKEQTRQNLDLQDIAKYTKTYASSSYLFFQGLEKKAFAANLADGYFDQKSHQYASGLSNLKLFIAPVISFLLIIIIANFSESIDSLISETWLSMTWPLIIANVLFGTSAAVVMLILQYSSEKRSEKGHREAEQWLSFKKHLKDYKKTKNYAIDSIILWEKYLVYGTLFGVSMKALSQLPVKFEDWSRADQQALVNYWGMSSVNLSQSAIINMNNFNLGSITHSLNSLGNAFNTISSGASRSYGASGGGSSGGFSGGGGGGGGGGAGGAG